MFSIKFIVDEAYLKKAWIESFPDGIWSQSILEETKVFLKELQAAWQKDESRITSLLEEVSGISFEGAFTVLVIHPSLEIGEYIDETSLRWGYKDMFPGYMTLGVAHELLHCLTHNYYIALKEDEMWLFHSLVYLTVDEELYKRLYNKRTYFSSPIVDTYHPRLIETARTILPEWKKYMKSRKTKSIYKLFESIQKNTL